MIRDAVIVSAPGGGDPAQRLLGMTLLQRQLVTLGKTGIERAFVVGTPVADDPRYAWAGIAVESLTLDQVSARITGPFLITRADVVHARETYAAVAEGATRDGELLRCGELYAATASGVQFLADLDAAPVRDLDAGDRAFSVRVDSPTSYRRAEKTLLRSLIKPVDGPVARHILRRLSLPMTRHLCKTSVSPNSLTALAVTLGAVGAWFVFQATWQTLALGGVLIFLQSIIDHNDGEIARLTFQESRIGQWFDHISDDALSTVYALAFGWASAQLLAEPLYWHIGIGSAIAISVFHLVHYAQLLFVYRSGNPFNFRWWFQRQDKYLKNDLAEGGVIAHIAEALHACGRRDVYVFAFLVFSVARVPQAAVLWYAVVAAAHAVLSVVHVAAGGMSRRIHAERS